MVSEETNWLKVAGLYMMAATFVQMVAFMLYKIFAQERLEDQSYVQNLMSQSRRNMKRMNAELQRFQLSLEMEGKRKQMEKVMIQAKERMDEDDDVPSLDLAPDRR